MAIFISNLVLLEGWKRLVLAFVCGAIASFAQAPFSWFALLWVCFPVFVWLLDSAALGSRKMASARSMAAVGWSFGFGFFLFSLYWLGAAFLVDAEQFAWLMPLAVIALPAGLALFWGAACALSAPLWSKSPLRIVWLALALSLVEWLRGIVFTGFPWGGLGASLASNSILMQTLALIGPNGMNLLAPIVFSLPVLIFSDVGHRKWGLASAALVVMLIMGQAGYGFLRLSAASQDAGEGQIVARLVQPNIPQKEKWKLENRSWIFNRLLALSTLDSGTYPLADVDLFIWPESSIPFYLLEQPAGLSAIANALPERASLLTGALRRQQDALTGTDQVYNSIYQISGDGTVQSSYDKIHLVPFGEYLPLRSLLESIGLAQLTAQNGGFEAGNRRKLIGDGHLGKILPLICYEIAFSRELLSYPDGAHMIVNVTNDAWFGKTIGPKQHLHLARMRAIETGLPVIRVANTGISAIIDPYGQVLQHLPLGEEGVLQSAVPARLDEPFYAQFGGKIFFLLWILLAFFALSIRKKTHTSGL